MSQQINLILPELRPRFDWLALHVVAGLAGAILLVLLTLVQWQSFRLSRQQSEEANINGQLLNLQQQVQMLGRTLTGRSANPDLPKEIAAIKAGIEQRREVLAFVGRGTGEPGQDFSQLLEGFARQAVDGVWLVGFDLSRNNIEIRGRLLDPAMLPVYIGRLDGDAVFAGKRFAALEMKDVDPAAEHPDRERKEETSPAPKRHFTEFVLRTEAVAPTERTP